MKIYKKVIIVVLFALTSWQLSAQSKQFKIGKNFEVLLNVIKEIEANYVDYYSLDSLLQESTSLLLSQLDPYTVLITEEEQESVEIMTTGSYGGIGSIIRKQDERIILSEIYYNSPADRAGLKDGDAIIEIDGEVVEPLTIEECSDKMKGAPGSSVLFKVIKIKGGDTVLQKVVREKVQIPDVTYSGMVADSVGYIRLSTFTKGGGREVKEALMELKKSDGLKRIVLDLRGNGGGLMNEAVEIASLFVPKGSLVVTSMGRDGRFKSEFHTSSSPIDTETPLFLLVNSGSASASEIVAGALQDLDRATIVGGRTFGKGLVQSIRDVGYRNQVKITTAKYYIPSGRSVQAVDYSSKEGDGKPIYLPDSLATPYKTLIKGRTVYEGGGISPDIAIEAENISRVTLALIYANILSDYSYLYYSTHSSIASPSSFELTDEEYLQFAKWAEKREFDHRSGTRVEFDRLVESAKVELIGEKAAKELEQLGKVLKRDKLETLLDFKEEIKSFLEEEIVNRFYYQSGRAEIMLRHDRQFEECCRIAPAI